MSLAVAMTGISKRFGSVAALDNVDLEVECGTIHALVGENGAGKTTLMRVLYGVIPPNSGSIEVNGSLASFANAEEAIRAGVGMVSQHYGIIPELTCLQNLVLGAEGGLLIDPSRFERRAESLTRRMGFAFDWRRKAEALSPAGSQKLEILKLLWREARIMILDEPTAMLSPADSDALFDSLKLLAKDGATVILVTHRLPEVMQHCTEVTVLRGGKRVAHRRVKDSSSRELAQLIVGGALAEPAPRSNAFGPALLQFEDLGVRGRRGGARLRGASLSVRAGEIVGIAGVDGSGQRELFQVLAGMFAPTSGSVSLDSRDILRDSAAERIRGGVRIIPEDRHEEGVIEDWALEENAALGLQRLPPFAAGALVDLTGRRGAAAAIAERFDTRHGGLRMAMRSLSGGNQQRFVAGRALYLHPKLLLAFQPARGLDLNSTTRVYDGIRRACAEGAAALVVSFDLDELIEYCDRVVAMNQGELLHPPPNLELDRDTIGRLMVGAA